MRFTAQPERNQLIVISLVAVVCIGAIALLQVPQLRQLRQRSQTATVEQIRRDVLTEKTRLSFLQKTPSFGFDNLVANWTFLSFLQYFGDDTARAKTDYRLSADYFADVLQRDPYFLQAYLFASNSIALYSGMPETSVALMQQGLRSLKPNAPPGSYYVWRQLGIDQLLFLGDSQSARQSFETAANWAMVSPEPGSAEVAELSRQTAAFLANNPNSRTAQVAAWTMVLQSAPDDRTQQMAISQIAGLGGRVIQNPDGTFKIQAAPSD